jgi:hypothetical protein
MDDIVWHQLASRLVLGQDYLWAASAGLALWWWLIE